MSKFEKRILEACSHHRNCLVVGSGLGMLDDLVDSMQTVFIINDGDRSIRKRNVVYRSNFQDIDVYTDIDLVIMDYNQYPNLRYLRALFLKCRPVTFVEGTELWPVDDYKYFRSFGYGLVEFYKHLQKWIPL